jgi:CAAX prenyl protease-like protein
MHRRSFVAHVLPMAVFLAFLAIGQWLPSFGEAFALKHAEFWVYPIQTICCGVLLVCFRRSYHFGHVRYVVFTVLLAGVVFLIWIFPQQFLGLAPRTLGFDPTLISDDPASYWLTLALRFLRLVIVVPFLEEIFWRAFLLRFLISEDFERVSFGQFSLLSFIVVTVVFAFSHARLDWPAALCAGALFNIVAYRTRSLSSCILAHALTNGLLGLWIMHTRQWGFW